MDDEDVSESGARFLPCGDVAPDGPSVSEVRAWARARLAELDGPGGGDFTSGQVATLGELLAFLGIKDWREARRKAGL